MTVTCPAACTWDEKIGLLKARSVLFNDRSETCLSLSHVPYSLLGFIKPDAFACCRCLLGT